jgi:hypothetical protein
MALCALTAVWLVDFRVVPNRHGGEVTWVQQLGMAQAQCARPGTKTATVSEPPGLEVTLPCQDVGT